MLRRVQAKNFVCTTSSSRLLYTLSCCSTNVVFAIQITTTSASLTGRKVAYGWCGRKPRCNKIDTSTTAKDNMCNRPLQRKPQYCPPSVLQRQSDTPANSHMQATSAFAGKLGDELDALPAPSAIDLATQAKQLTKASRNDIAVNIVVVCLCVRKQLAALITRAWSC